MSAVKQLVTPQQYLAFEQDSDTKHEYISGEILAMAGGTPAHSTLCMDVALALGVHLQAVGGSCDVHNSEQKVRAGESGPFFYPDATVVCGTPEYDDDDCLRNPTLIVEVLSPSSIEYDRGEKFRNYRRFETLQHYLMVEQDRRRVEYYRRVEGMVWDLVGEYTAPDAVISLTDLGIELPLATIYRRSSFT